MTSPEAREQRRWQRAVREHGAALESFVEFVKTVAEEDWRKPLREGKWAPAEVSEHLALAYEATLRELQGGPAMAPRLSTAWQSLLRWFLLPHMLYHRTMPRVRAPRETRPAGVPETKRAGIERLLELADRAEREWSARPAGRLHHPYFGELNRVRLFRLAALHLEHHQRLLAVAVTRAR